jgi:hypothetical protein
MSERRIVLAVDRSIIPELKYAASKRGMTIRDYVTLVLRSATKADAEHLAGRREEPMSDEALASLVRLVATATSEDPEAYMARVLRRAVVLDFALHVASDQAGVTRPQCPGLEQAEAVLASA